MDSKNDKLKQCLIEAMEADVAKLKEQTAAMEPYVFSEKFEENMQEIIDGLGKKSNPFPARKVAAAAVLVLAIGVFGISTSHIDASKPQTDILAWVKEYFNFEKGDNSRHNEDVLFEEARLGNIPEGFEKVGEEVSFSTVIYKFANDAEEYITICVSRNEISFAQDGDEVEYIVKQNDAGYEYVYTYKEDENTHVFIWEDAKGASYKLSGSLEIDEMIDVMNGIKY